MRRVLLAPIGLSLVLFSGTTSAQTKPEPRELSPAELGRVRSGEILIWSDVGRKYGESVALIEGTVDELAAILFDWDSFPDWIPAQSVARTLERREEEEVVYKVVYGESKMPFPFARRKYRADVEAGFGDGPDGERVAYMTWKYIPGSGNLKQSSGFWYIRPWSENAELTLARYVVYADPGIWLPGFIIDWATRDVLPKIMKAIRERHDDLH